MAMKRIAITIDAQTIHLKIFIMLWYKGYCNNQMQIWI